MKKVAAVAVAVVVLGSMFAVGTAPAESVLHLKLDASSPAADQVLDASPEKIVLEFSEWPELTISRIVIEDAKLSRVARSEEDETILWVSVEEPLASGTHTVSWVTSSGDGHPVRGEFSFTVGAGR